MLYGGLQRVVQADFTRIDTAPPQCCKPMPSIARRTRLSPGIGRLATYTLYVPGRSDYVWYDEPFLCVVPSRFWIFAARVDLDGFARIIRSPDRGRTWEPVLPTPVWGFPQHLLPLGDGRLLMTYGYRRPPFGVWACLSSDCGQTWDLANELIPRRDGGTPPGQPRKVVDGDLGYPTSVQLADGTIFTVYCHNTAGSNCFIAGTFRKLPESGSVKKRGDRMGPYRPVTALENIERARPVMARRHRSASLDPSPARHTSFCRPHAVRRKSSVACTEYPFAVLMMVQG